MLVCISGALGPAWPLIFGSLSASVSLCASPRLCLCPCLSVLTSHSRKDFTRPWTAVTTDLPCVLRSFLILYSQFYP